MCMETCGFSAYCLLISIFFVNLEAVFPMQSVIYLYTKYKAELYYLNSNQ